METAQFLLSFDSKQYEKLDREKSGSRLWLLPLLMFVIASPLSGQEERQDERPDTAKLLPETTQMYVEIGNIREFMEKMQETGMGQVFENEKVADLVDNLYTDMAGKL